MENNQFVVVVKKDYEVRLMANEVLNSNKSVICEVLNKYFTTIGKKLAGDKTRAKRPM